MDEVKKNFVLNDEIGFWARIDSFGAIYKVKINMAEV